MNQSSPLFSEAFTPSWSSVVGQDRMKLALLLAAVDQGIGGVLIRGERGTAKSTLVRALAGVLPAREVVVGCPYGCSPGDAHLCRACARRLAAGESLKTASVPTRVVELPLGASEDRVVGSLDLERALQEGSRVFQPGLLAEANGQVLYVDEVNLLDHHLVDVLLDAAAMGVSVVEREGISETHPSRFLLVGTMNPEEGELRPQLLDRFGLCVDVGGLQDPAQRVLVMRSDHAAVRGQQPRDLELAARVGRARQLLPQIQVPRSVLETAAAIAIDQGVMGHRADLVLHRAARAIRALRLSQAEVRDELAEVTLQDLVDVTELVLVHRRRSAGSMGLTAGAADQSLPQEGVERASVPTDLAQAEQQPAPGGESDDSSGPTSEAGEPSDGAGPEAGAGGGSPGPGPSEEVEVLAAAPTGRIELPRERLRRHGAGRRSHTVSRDRRGRYVGATVVERTTDLALDATLRAAAPHQRGRGVSAGAAPLAIRLEKQDLRQKIRQRRIGNLIVFLVDASASMDAEQRMDATRSAILALLKDAYVRRDRVAMITFSGRTARTVLRPTASVDLAERQLSRLAVGGTTPLTHGLVAALEMIHTERMRDPEVLPLLVLISDGRGNISMRGEEPLVEAQQAALAVRREKIRALVIDSARDRLGPELEAASRAGGGAPQFAGYGFNACFDLASRMGAQYFGLFDVSEQGILRPVADALRRAG